jgi:hypothetical protein
MKGRVPGTTGANADRRRSGAATALGWVAAGAVTGCGGGLPLLHPARTLPAGDVAAGAGFSGNIATGGLANALGAAREEAAVQGPTLDATYARGALVAASVATGLAPVVTARVGLGWSSEGGLAYTGRGLRADLRRSFDLTPHWAVSAGVGGSAALYGHQDGGGLPDVDLAEVHGWGADVPVLLGYESDGQLYMLWLGVRGGWEHVDVSNLTSDPGSAPAGGTPIAISATRFWGGGLLGFAVGFRHVHVAMELDASYANIAGNFAQVHASVQGVTLAPATALWWHF